MKLNKIIITASLALLPLTAGAATLIIPAAASTSGANGSDWKSELTLHNTSGRDQRDAALPRPGRRR